MKTTKIIFLLSIISLLATSCTGSDNNKYADYSDPHVATEYVDESNYSYTNRIDEPSSVIHNMNDLSKITDYHAFYKDVNSFVVTLDNYQYSTKQKAVKNEINYLYWYGGLVNGAIGITGSALDKKHWKIEFQYYHDNYIDGHATQKLLNDLCYEEPANKRPNDYDSFVTNAGGNRVVVDVATTQQLWYAVEYGYAVNPLPDSPAEKYYNLAKDVLRDIIDDEMNDYEKVSAIYDYIEHHATYCFEALYAPAAKDENNYPDEICSGYKAFYIEGFFDNKTVVCDGFSKVYTLLGGMEGLDIRRAIGTPDKKWVTKSVAGHAYCYVKIDDQYYLSCPTWGQNNLENQNAVTLNKDYFLSPFDYISPYTSTNWPEIESTKSINKKQYFENTTFKVDSLSYDTYVESSDDLTPYVNAAKSNTHYFIDLLFDSKDTLDSFVSNIKTISAIKYMPIDKTELVVWKY